MDYTGYNKLEYFMCEYITKTRESFIMLRKALM